MLQLAFTIQPSNIFISMLLRVSGDMKTHFTVIFLTEQPTVQATTQTAHHSVVHSNIWYSSKWANQTQ